MRWCGHSSDRFAYLLLRVREYLQWLVDVFYEGLRQLSATPSQQRGHRSRGHSVIGVMGSPTQNIKTGFLFYFKVVF